MGGRGSGGNAILSDSELYDEVDLIIIINNIKLQCYQNLYLYVLILINPFSVRVSKEISQIFRRPNA